MARTFTFESRLVNDLHTPVFRCSRFPLARIKATAKACGTSFASTVCAMYLQMLFAALPEAVHRLKLFVPVYVANPNRFSQYSVLPIVVERLECTPHAVNASMTAHRNCIVGFHELFRSDATTPTKVR